MEATPSSTVACQGSVPSAGNGQPGVDGSTGLLGASRVQRWLNDRCEPAKRVMQNLELTYKGNTVAKDAPVAPTNEASAPADVDLTGIGAQFATN